MGVAHQRASLVALIETQNAAHATEVIIALRAAGFEVRFLEGAGTGGF